jgi:hypothetical protein
MLALLRASVSDEEMVAIIRALVTKALEGDVSAAKLIMSYNLGKPLPAPNPDEMDRDEWDHYQRDTINIQDVQQVLGSLPSSVGNDLARTALPVMSQAHKEEIASHLVKSQAPARRVTNDPMVAPKTQQTVAPIPIGNSGDSKSSTHDPRLTIYPSRQADASTLALGYSRSTNNDSPPTPIGNSTNNQSPIPYPRFTTNDQRSTNSSHSGCSRSLS